MSEESWTETMANMKERLRKDGDDETLADVVFRFNQNNDENVVEFKAHKLVLGLKSEVFKAMFFGSFKKDDVPTVVDVCDITAKAFDYLLDFVYTNNVELREVDVAGLWNVWAAAHKYMIWGLLDKCRSALLESLNEVNAPIMLQLSNFYEEHGIQYKALRIVDAQASDSLLTCDMEVLDKKTLIDILNRRTLGITECDAFKAASAFFEAHRNKEGLSFNDFLPALELGTMTSLEFVHHVLPKNVLTNDLVVEKAIMISTREQEEMVATNEESKKFYEEKKKFYKDKLAFYEELEKICKELEDDPYDFDFDNSDLCRLRDDHRHAEFVAPPESLKRKDIDSELTVHRIEGENIRLGPGNYQATRFLSKKPLLFLQEPPETHTLRFKVNKDIFLMGICVTERDRTLHSPRLSFSLELKNNRSELLSNGKASIRKQSSSSATKERGGLPVTSASDLGPHDIWLTQVEDGKTYIKKDQWHELVIKIEKNENFDPWDPSPLLLVQCKQEMESFGVTFEFEEQSNLGIKDEDTGTNTENEAAKNEEDEAAKSDKNKNDEGVYGLVSRLYFYY